MEGRVAFEKKVNMQRAPMLRIKVILWGSSVNEGEEPFKLAKAQVIDGKA